MEGAALGAVPDDGKRAEDVDMGKRKLVAGNWKMNGTAGDLAEARAIADSAGDGVDVALCLPATLIERAVRAVPGLAIGGQDVHRSGSGAHTGDVSAAMLVDAGAKLTIVGHSERRADHGETSADVRAKAEAGQAAGLDVILCIGESLSVREAGEAIATVTAQLGDSLPGSAERLTVAYEPIWAIGTGKVPSVEDIADMHGALRARLDESFGADGAGVRILYGGSVKASNAAEIFAIADVDGALVGGASLTAADFLPIVDAARAH
jgi:triosephosphate isomerase